MHLCVYVFLVVKSVCARHVGLRLFILNYGFFVCQSIMGLFVCIYMSVYVYVSERVFLSVCRFISVCVSESACVSTDECVFVCVCVCISL